MNALRDVVPGKRAPLSPEAVGRGISGNAKQPGAKTRLLASVVRQGFKGPKEDMLSEIGGILLMEV